MEPVITSEYTLWLEPQGEAAVALTTLIRDLAKRSTTPAFVPHVTLLPGVHGEESALVEKTRQLAEQAQGIPLHFSSIGTGEKYHACVFLKGTDTDALLELHRRAARQFGTPEGGYQPHLSLIYGLESGPLKRELVGELEHLNFSSLTYTPTTISLWKAYGTPEEWTKIVEFPCMKDK